MKMGIERVLREKFLNLGDVVSVSPTVADPSLTVEMVNEGLAKIIPAVQGMGGKMEVSKVEATTGTVVLRFAGPARLQKGLEMVLKDISSVKVVLFEEFPSA